MVFLQWWHSAFSNLWCSMILFRETHTGRLQFLSVKCQQFFKRFLRFERIHSFGQHFFPLVSLIHVLTFWKLQITAHTVIIYIGFCEDREKKYNFKKNYFNTSTGKKKLLHRLSVGFSVGKLNFCWHLSSANLLAHPSETKVKVPPWTQTCWDLKEYWHGLFILQIRPNFHESSWHRFLRLVV